jgi:hypothetical protein
MWRQQNGGDAGHELDATGATVHFARTSICHGIVSAFL